MGIDAQRGQLVVRQTEAMSVSGWHRVGPVAEVETTGARLFRRGGRQIVIFATHEGLFAVNNRCPHEGYPLKEGSVDSDCVITCNWHNWKFNLKTGENLYGGDQLRTYPVEVRESDVWIDLTDPPREQQVAAILQALREAFDDNAYDRMGREIARLRLTGADPVDAVRAAIRWSYDRMEFGWTHAFAGASDWLELYDEHSADEETQLVCLLETVAHLADDVLREEIYPFPDDSARYDEESFIAAIESEDEAKAIAGIRGGLADGLTFGDFERGLSRAALAHYNDFGHALIYTLKAGRLIQRLGEDSASPLLFSLVRAMIYATREDLIPEFRRYAPTLENWGGNDESSSTTPGDYRKLSVNKALALIGERSRAPNPGVIQCAARRQRLQHAELRYVFSESVDPTDAGQRGLAEFHAWAHLRQCGSHSMHPVSRACGLLVCCKWHVSAGAMHLTSISSKTPIPGGSTMPMNS